MKQKYKILLILFLNIFCFLQLRSQNQVAVGQYMYHHALFNPAAMGSYQEIRGALLMRQQWVGVEGAPRLYALNVSLPFDKMAVGLSLYQTEIGIRKETQIYGAYSYRLKLQRDEYLSFGIAGGAVLQNWDYTSVVTSDQNDQSFASDLSSKLRPDFQLGTYYFRPKFYAGLFIPGILKSEVSIENGKNKIKTSFDTKILHLYFQTGYEHDLAYDFRLNVSSLVKYVANAPVQADLNAMINWQDFIGFGVSYRTSDQILGLINFRISDKLLFGYAYQYSSVVKQHFNSHELMLVYSMNNKKRKRIRIQSPRF